MFTTEPEAEFTFFQRLKIFLVVHWKGLVCVLTPIILIFILAPFPPKGMQWCGYTLILMAIYWVTDCAPVAVTSFLPIVIFPLTGVSTTSEVCKSYFNDTIIMFLGSLILAYSVEQSGLHKRLAYFAIRTIGYSHIKLLLAISIVTTFVSMWITNTAATTMMVPINFAVLRVFDTHNICKLYDTNKYGEKVASDITTAYFCLVTYSATIGGIGTLVGTATNLAFKGLFQIAYPAAPEELSFPKFTAFAFPYMVIMEAILYLIVMIQYFGLFRPKSDVAQRAKINKKGIVEAEKAILADSKKMGKFSFWEAMVLILFGGAMIGFFCRSPQIFPGWGDAIEKFFDMTEQKYVRDSALAMLVSFLMFLLPSTLAFFHVFKAKYLSELPKGRVTSVLDWKVLNSVMPFSFMFLLGGGFALSNAARTTGLNDKIGETLKELKDLPNVVIILIITILVVFITNFASNVAVANVMVPLAMQLAKEINQNPLWFAIVAGFASSYCFMIPVGTPGNLVVQGAASIPTPKMVKAGALPTLAVVLVTWIAMCFWLPVIWPVVKTMPEWVV